MRSAGRMPSIVPNKDDQNVHIVLDDFGLSGRAFRETDADRSDLEAVVMEMLEGQYGNPVERYEGRYRGVQLPLPIRLI
jgi:hypothetical protein